MWIKSKQFEYTLIILICLLLGGLIGSGIRYSENYTSGCQKKQLGIQSVSHEYTTKIKDVISLQNAFVKVAEQVSPCVVNLSVEKVIRGRGFLSPWFEFRREFEGTPFEEFFRDFFGGDRFGHKYREHSLGSGFIVDRRGYILTNYHVIKGADEIIVKLLDGREFKGKIIGVDKKIDLALIKIDTRESLPAAKLGSSSKARVGDWVIAIGNPFGLEHTITVGVISAKGRSLQKRIAEYEHFIQTDASINPGNSGGPLVNIYGEVIGINTAIVASGQGIGFAIPIDMAKHIIRSLIKHGKVIRAWLGVYIQEIDPKLAKYFRVKPHEGILVADVVRRSPAKRAGIKRGDIIKEINGKEVTTPGDLQEEILKHEVGDKIELLILRDNKEMVVKVKLARMPEDTGEFIGSSMYSRNWRGMVLQDITPELASKYKLSDDTQGVIIIEVQRNTPASDAELRVGDVILGINNISIHSLKEFNKIIDKIHDEEDVVLIVKRRYYTFFVSLEGED